MDFETKVLNMLGEILQRVSNLDERIAVLEQNVRILKEDVSLLKTKVYVIEEKLNNLEDEVKELKEDHIYLSQTVAKIEFESDTKFQTLFDYIEVNRDDHRKLENLINSKISENKILFKTILENHEERITALESAKIS